jgi:pyroglutamyl-peptidase
LILTSTHAGFVHMPYVPEQAIAHPGAPGMALDDIFRALAIIVRCAIEWENDIVYGSGTEC